MEKLSSLDSGMMIPGYAPLSLFAMFAMWQE